MDCFQASRSLCVVMVFPLVHHRSLITQFVPQHPIHHPPHGDQVVERFEQPVAHTVFRLTVNARVMPNRHFSHGESMHLRERREKPVHAFIQRDALQHGAPEYFERTSRIVHAVVSEPVSHAVRNSGGDHLYEAVLPLLSPSAHEIVAGREGEQFQDIFAVLLKVAVDLDDDLAGGLPKSRIEGAGLTVIPVEVKHLDLGMLRCQTIQFLATAVAAAVIHKNNLVGA